MPLPRPPYAPVVKSYRHRRIVRLKRRVVFGTLEAVNQVLAKRGWQMNTAFVERLNMGDDLGLGEVPGGANARVKLFEEAQIQIDFPVDRAVKWARCRLGESAR
jgi:hypothetical protein